MKARIEATHRVHRRLEFVQLILGQGLGREQIHRAGARVFDHPLQYRQVVAQRLAAGGRRHHHHVVAGGAMFKRLGLVHIKLRNAPCNKGIVQGGRDARGNPGILAFPRRLMPDRANRRLRIRHPLPELRDRSFDPAAFARDFCEGQSQIHINIRLFFARVHDLDLLVYSL